MRWMNRGLLFPDCKSFSVLKKKKKDKWFLPPPWEWFRVGKQAGFFLLIQISHSRNLPASCCFRKYCHERMHECVTSGLELLLLSGKTYLKPLLPTYVLKDDHICSELDTLNAHGFYKAFYDVRTLCLRLKSVETFADVVNAQLCIALIV